MIVSYPPRSKPNSFYCTAARVCIRIWCLSRDFRERSSHRLQLIHPHDGDAHLAFLHQICFPCQLPSFTGAIVCWR